MAARGSRKSSQKYAVRAGYTPGSMPRWSSSGHNGPRPHARRSDRPGDPEQRAKGCALSSAKLAAHRCAHCAKPVGESRAKRLDGYGTSLFHGGCTRRALRFAVRRFGADSKAVRLAAQAGAPWTAADLADLAAKAEPGSALQVVATVAAALQQTPPTPVDAAYEAEKT